MVWGVDLWATGGSLALDFVKVVSNSQDLTFDYAGADFRKAAFAIGSVTPAYEISSEQLSQGRWNYVLTNEPVEVWTPDTEPDVTFTCQAANGTSWSEV
jgi:hypothetical protein